MGRTIRQVGRTAAADIRSSGTNGSGFPPMGEQDLDPASENFERASGKLAMIKLHDGNRRDDNDRVCESEETCPDLAMLSYECRPHPHHDRRPVSRPPPTSASHRLRGE